MRIALPALVFWEHFDFKDAWLASPGAFPAEGAQPINEAELVPPVLGVKGDFDAVAACGQRFPQLTILTGVEFGQSHLREAQPRDVVDLSRFNSVNGCLNKLPFGADGPSRSRWTSCGMPTGW